ncbi:MAG TPA: hypothetical protein DCZ03_05050 [Gammaproteobacteria bacterium]|nr:hypothetical protein [Gammaproteobacteria bacterium]
MTDKDQPELERRDFYRIQDKIGLTYQTVTEQQFLSREYLKYDESDAFTLLSELNKLDNENYIHLRNLSHHHREIAEYFDVINRKIRLLARAIVNEDEKFLHSPTHDVNISAGGLSFPSTESLEVNTLLDMRIVLFPTLLGIRTLGKIIHVAPSTASEPNSVAVHFIEIAESDQQALVKHVLRKQSEELKLARESKDSDSEINSP